VSCDTALGCLMQPPATGSFSMRANAIKECCDERKAHRLSSTAGFVDGAGREGVYGILRKNGHDVSSIHSPTLSLATGMSDEARLPRPVGFVVRLRVCSHHSPTVMMGSANF
jgi:hypothetical protein